MPKAYRFFVFLIVLFTIISCKKTTIQEGVSLELAVGRKAQISDINYNLKIHIPKSKTESIGGKVNINFILNEKIDIVLDFRSSADMVKGVYQTENPISYTFENGHIIIPKHYTNIGENSFTVEFISGNGSLNRSEEFLYTLLVPDRASTVFPCFDQPDMKGTFQLTLQQPTNWTSLSNGKVDSITYLSDTEKKVYFKSTQPISTYLFAFAVGNFKVETKTVNGKTFSIYHRETDKEKLERNLPILFDLHAQSLAWLEDYTGIPYPFSKLDFILIPGFQYSGMEHPGAIFYRDSRLLLNENPSINQRLSQANLIAHEVAHQWFGNLVTMRWFNDVWLKEVFAGFMADLIVNPQYPDVNHELSFLLSHFPRSYSVDRTKGANPIVQPLENMLNAGTLYGDIIYHKAPIMMQQLEMLMGAEAFKTGVREYLNKYKMGNANWDELVSILDTHTESNLKEWAEIWTLQTGRPIVAYNVNNTNKTLEIKGLDSSPMPPMWIDLNYTDDNKPAKRIWLNQLPVNIDISENIEPNKSIILNSSGLGYGCFVPDENTLEWFMTNPMSINNPVERASTHISLYEMFLEDLIDIDSYTNFLIKSIENESEAQIQNYLLNNLVTVFWRFNSQVKRDQIADKVESTLWKLIQSELPNNQRRTVFATLVSVFTTNELFSKLYTVWAEAKIFDLTLNENERTSLAYELMIRKPELFHTIAFGEIERLDNPDRIAKFEFTLRAVSPNLSERLAFFESLSKPENRKPEPWVTDALMLLHHPLRSDFSIRFLETSLNMLPEIQQTGDIFFPKSWIDATLWGHSSPEAIDIVKNWIDTNPDLSPNLKSKLLQSADLMFRVEHK